jgi:hypothetical protein
MRNIKLNLSNGYILSVSNEMDDKIHDGLVEVALLDSDREFVNTKHWLNDTYDEYEVERFVSAKRLANIIRYASSYADERIAR